MAVLSALLGLADAQTNALDGARGALASAFTPIKAAATIPLSLFSGLENKQDQRQDLSVQVQRLEARLERLLARQQRMHALEAENEELRRLISAARRFDDKFVHAEVLAHSLDPFTHRITVNRGYNARAAAGQAVVDRYGLVGQVVEVGNLSSQVLLITDANHQVPVKIGRTGELAVLRGTGHHDRLALIDVPITSDVKAGDDLMTSGLGQRFPEGYPVARVVQVKRDPGRAFAEVLAVPLAQSDRSGSVMLVYRSQTARDRAVASLENSADQP